MNNFYNLLFISTVALLFLLTYPANGQLVKDKQAGSTSCEDTCGPEFKWLRRQVEELSQQIEELRKTTEKNVSRLTAKTEGVLTDVSSIQQRGVLPPIGAVYVQFRRELEPAKLWPNAEWKNISGDYAGEFFRSEGGDSLAFGQIQGDNTVRINEIGFDRADKGNGNYECTAQRDINCAYPLKAGDTFGFRSEYKYGVQMRFRTSAGEVRPRNSAIRLWVRTM